MLKYLLIATALVTTPALAGADRWGSGNTNINTNIAAASAAASARASALSFAHSNSNATGGRATVVNNVGNGHNPWWQNTTTVAPSLAGNVGVGVCSSQFGLSLGFIGTFGILVPVSDAPCNARADYATYRHDLPVAVGRAYPYANSEAVRAAYKSAGY